MEFHGLDGSVLSIEESLFLGDIVMGSGSDADSSKVIQMPANDNLISEGMLLDSNSAGVSLDDTNFTFAPNLASTPAKGNASEKKHVCGICLYGTDFKSNFRRHVLTHENADSSDQCDQSATSSSEASSYLCHVCCKPFRSRNGVKNHILMKHPTSDSKVLKCHLCGAVKYSKVDIQGHIDTHTANPKHECVVCSKQYFHKKTLMKHLVSCTGPCHTCDVCATTFSSKHCLKEHMAGKHSGKTYRCPCGHNFKWRESLKRHKKNANH